MVADCMGKVVKIPANWEMCRVADGQVCVNIEGHTEMELPLAQFSDAALRQVRAMLLGRIHTLTIKRASVYKHISAVNGELDRRTNEGV